MGFAGSNTAAVAVRGFGRAGIGVPGARRVPFAPVASEPEPAPKPLPRGLRDRFAGWDKVCCRIEARFAGRVAVDLRAQPGSRRWWLGVARLAALVALLVIVMLAFPIDDPASWMAGQDGQSAAWRAQAIQPLAQGGTNGRHFAATDAVVRVDSVPERPTIALDAVLAENDDMAKMLTRIGLDPRDADAVRGMVAPLGTPNPGTHFAVTLGPRAATGVPRPLQSLQFRPKYDLDVTISRNGNGLTLARRDIPVDATPMHLVGSSGTSLYHAARDAGADPDTVQQFLQALDQYVPLEAIQPTDRFELVVEHKRALDGTASGAGQDGNLLYAGLVRDGQPVVQIMRWGKEGNFFTLDALTDEASQGSSLLAAPVSGNITSWFGMRRHPLLGYVRLHAGIDFGAAYGSPIYAVSDGTVTYAGWHGGHGNYVRLDHGGGIGTGYGHMSRIAVSPGMHVSRGEVIGYVGSTGLSTGPHLHYELWRGGQPVDPLSMRFAPHHVGVSAEELAQFKTKMQQLLAIPRAGAQALALR